MYNAIPHHPVYQAHVLALMGSQLLINFLLEGGNQLCFNRVDLVFMLTID